ncbi:MAG: hypothetical protein KGL39_53670 [Patescibacteria group bacterium]|nr:hypothetical protein [Patescibacteria group bacterium]
MLVLKDGPAAKAFVCRHAPDYLRAVVGKDGALDVLDAPNDVARDDERLYVYRLVSEVRPIHINGVHFKGFAVSADYVFMPEVNGEAVRDNREWRKWLNGEHVEAQP